MIDVKLSTLLTAGLAALLIVSCTKEPVSATDPLPLPSGAEAGKAFIDAQKARFPQPKTKEEAFITIGKLIAEGNPAWGSMLFQAWRLVWKDGKLMGNLLPLLESSSVRCPLYR